MIILRVINPDLGVTSTYLGVTGCSKSSAYNSKKIISIF